MPWILWLVTLDPLSLLPLAPGLFLTIWARRRVRKSWAGASAEIPVTGGEAATLLASGEGGAATVQACENSPTDFYDPWVGTIRLSRSVREGRTVAAMAVSCHEAAFAGLPRLAKIRGQILLATSLGSLASWLVLAAAIVYRDTAMAEQGMKLYSAVVIGSLLSVPIARMANRRARPLLEVHPAINPSETGEIFASALDANAWRIVAIPLTSRPMRL